MRNHGTKHGVADAFEREAIAYAVGRTEEWARQFAESLGLSYAHVASGISTALGDPRYRPPVQVRALRGAPTKPSKVLQPKVALGRRPRKPLPEKGHHSRRRLDGRTISAIKAGIKLGQPALAIARRLHISDASVHRYAHAA